MPPLLPPSHKPVSLSKWLSLLIPLLLLAFLADIAWGSVRIPLPAITAILFSSHGNKTWQYIIEQIRIPKACTAVLVGCGLSVGGLQMQTLFRNPLADPSVLGITSGASLGVAAVMLSTGSMANIYAVKELGISSSWLLIAASTLGAALVMTLILAISSSVRDNAMMLIIGVMTGNITLSVISIWQYFSAPEQVKDFLLWTFGSLGGVSGGHLAILAVAVGAGLLLSMASSKMLDALLLGENYARSMGLTARRARILVVCSTSLLAGSITTFCGPIGFIGIAVPFLARTFFHVTGHRALIPICSLTGAVLMLLCDTVSQQAGNGSVLPINVITALIGSPVVIWIIAGRNNLKKAG